MARIETLRKRAAVALVSLGISCVGVALVPTVDAGPRRIQFEGWAPPAWHPQAEALESLVAMDQPPSGRVEGLSARSTYLYDVDAGEVLHAHNADDRRPVASLTKLTTVLAWASEGKNLQESYCVDSRFYPTRSGAYSKLSTGECYRGWDLLGAALVSSDNRGAYGVQVASGLPFDAFIGRMDQVSWELGMTQSTWAEPSGLDDENLSTARDMAKAAWAVSAHPTLSIPATSATWRLEQADGTLNRELYATDRLVARTDLELLAGKTGYTDTAGYCFAGVVRTKQGRTVAFSVLGAPSSSKRWADVDRLLASL